MKLKHDAQGFLTGQPLDLGNRTAQSLESICTDIKAIRAVLLSNNFGIKASAKRQQHALKPSATATPRPRDEQGRFVAAPKPALPKSRDSQASGIMPASVPASANEPQSRDGQGRYIPPDDASPSPSSIREAREFSTGIGDAIASRLRTLKDMGGDMGEADPAVKAMQEVAEPMSRGWALLAGDRGERKKEGWFRRIFGELRFLRKDESTFNKEQKKLLKGIEKKTGKGFLGNIFGGGQEGGGIGDWFKNMLGIGGGVAGGGLLTRAFGGLFGGIAKKLPWLAALFEGGKLAFGLASDEMNPDLSPEERRDRRYRRGGAFGAKIGGMVLGAKAGALLGSLAGPIGTALGGFLGGVGGYLLGDKFGDKVGEWTKSLMDADIPVMMKLKWDALTHHISDAWASFATTATESWDKVTGGFQSLLDSYVRMMKDKFGIDLPEIWTKTQNAYKQTKDAIQENAGIANQWIKGKSGVDVKGTVNQGIEAVKSTANRAWESTRSVASQSWQNIKDWTLGKTSQTFESGKGGAGTVSSGKGDHGGASYGTYQLSSKQGTLNKFLEQSGYDSEFNGMEPGTKEFNQKWKDLADSDPGFGTAQHDFIKATHYDPAVEGLKDAGIDLSGKGAAVQDAIWSTSVQFGPGGSKGHRGAVPMIKKALAGMNPEAMSDAEIITAIQNYKADNTASLFPSSPKLHGNLTKRALTEKERLLALANSPLQTSATPPQPIPAPVANQPPSAPTLPTPSNPPTPMEAPSVPAKIGGDKDRSLTVTMPATDAGQCVSDRGITHIVTGGYARI